MTSATSADLRPTSSGRRHSDLPPPDPFRGRRAEVVGGTENGMTSARAEVKSNINRRGASW